MTDQTKEPNPDAQRPNEPVVMRFEAEYGEQLKRYFWAVTLTEITKDNLWWNTTQNRWEVYGSNPCDGYSTHAPCRTVRAFKRMLKKHPEIKNRCCLVNKYKGFDVYA